jgi:hypothetical protein
MRTIIRTFSIAVIAAAVLSAVLMAVAAGASGQVGIGVNAGPAPECPYGYYDAAPYNCAPYGYYGPEWFNDGVFIGSGPWFHGDEHFQGRVDNRFHPDNGYHGEHPHRGDHAEKHIDAQHFRGNETRDGRGHIGGGERQRK